MAFLALARDPGLNAALAGAGLALVLLPVSVGSAPWIREAAEWQDMDRSRAPVAPLLLEEVTWLFRDARGGSALLRGAALEAVPRTIGPFALNPDRRLELRDARLEMVGADGEPLFLRAERALCSEERIELVGRVRGFGPTPETFPADDRFVVRRGDLLVPSAGERSASDPRSPSTPLPADGVAR